MADPTPAKTQPVERLTSPVEPVVPPDVAIQPHPTADSLPPMPVKCPKGIRDRLQDVLPEINAVAKKVGGFRKLAEIAAQLEQEGE
jgi:hypothetical protein